MKILKPGDHVLMVQNNADFPFVSGQVKMIPPGQGINVPPGEMLYRVRFPAYGASLDVLGQDLIKVESATPIRRLSELRVRALMRKMYPAITCGTAVLRFPEYADRGLITIHPRLDLTLYRAGELPQYVKPIPVQIQEYYRQQVGDRFFLRLFAGYAPEEDTIVVTYGVQIESAVPAFPLSELAGV